MRPELAAVVALYEKNPHAGVKTITKGGNGYKKLSPKGWPPEVHYEFHWNESTGRVDVELHDEFAASGDLPKILEAAAKRLASKYSEGIRFDAKWLSGCRVVATVPVGATDNVVTTMHKLIDDTFEEVAAWVRARAAEAAAGAELPARPATSASGSSLNTILYGPPGTGKTYTTINKALGILDPAFVTTNPNRPQLKQRFDELQAAKRIEFVTFHQSFSYEDFVEGLRAWNDEASGDLRYSIEDGVFKRLCQRAETAGAAGGASLGVRAEPRIWKISIDGTGPSKVRDYCFKHGQARIGWGDSGDLRCVDVDGLALGTNDKSSLRNFSADIQAGDVLLCIRSVTEVQAIGVVTGEYHYDKEPPSALAAPLYQHVLPVKWLATGLSLSVLVLNANTRFTLKTVYELPRFSWSDLLAALKATGTAILGPAKTGNPPEKFVLIIDEINRGNISRVFGELITLIETSKRAGREEALQVQLPYSKRAFSVPDNVHIIGTMNTADRSLATLDNALRRRFRFEEMAPKPELLDEVTVDGINIGKLLRVMNERIEVLFDRDHCLGHAYLLPLKAEPTLAKLAQIFLTEIIPLLQEYFFEDWQKIAWVLNDHRKDEKHQFLRRVKTNTVDLFGDDVTQVVDRRWTIQGEAFSLQESYLGIIGKAP
jgi:5-methylcytosine-specific restriction protein B